ncbi:hypothetical protein DFP73DRAFT_524675 [Morchella snyderi]|nr:hypothetical protein DFP73DRAFT_524675 [Morchella snyderi]
MPPHTPNRQHAAPQPASSSHRLPPSKMRDDVKALMTHLAQQHKDITVLVEEICVLSQVVHEANGILRTSGGGHTHAFFEDVVALRASLQRARRTLATAQLLAADAVAQVEEMVAQMERVRRYAVVGGMRGDGGVGRRRAVYVGVCGIAVTLWQCFGDGLALLREYRYGFTYG